MAVVALRRIIATAVRSGPGVAEVATQWGLSKRRVARIVALEVLRPRIAQAVKDGQGVAEVAAEYGLSEDLVERMVAIQWLVVPRWCAAIAQAVEGGRRVAKLAGEYGLREDLVEWIARHKAALYYALIEELPKAYRAVIERKIVEAVEAGRGVAELAAECRLSEDTVEMIVAVAWAGDAIVEAVGAGRGVAEVAAAYGLREEQVERIVAAV